MKENQKKSQFFNRILPFVFPLLLIAVGILLLINADLLNKIFIVCGCILALLGFTEVVIYGATAQYEKKPRVLITGSILLILAAVFILLPITFDLLIPFCIGAFVLLNGLGSFIDTVRISHRDTRWIIALVFNMAVIAAGIIILFNVWNGVIYKLIGIMLIISGGLSLMEQILIATVKKSNSKVIDAEAKEIH